MVRPVPSIWEAILAHLRQHHPGICRHWFDDIDPIEHDQGTLKLLVREQVQLKYLQRCCTEQFTEAAQSVTGRLLAVQFVGEADLVDGGTVNGNTTTSSVSANDDMVILPDYTFENYVVGGGNQLAYAAAHAVSKKPARAYNPLFIHGGVGLGKTHLLQAICRVAVTDRPEYRIYYTSCDNFRNQFFDAVQAGQMNNFRHRFRDVDILVIDDIHHLSKGDRTQEEFFHTFNTLYQSGKQIILSSDAPPNEIPDLEERLTSRFNCGLVAGIEKPGFETRVAIVRAKAALRNVPMPDEVATYIAAKVDTNIRELEGAITTLQGLAMVMNGDAIDLELAKQAIGEPLAVRSGTNPTIQDIIDAVTGYYDVKLIDLLSKRRHKSIALPRQVGMWLARRHTRYSLEEIGGYFGGRDHTTVMHAIRAINTRRESDSGLSTDVSRLEEQVMGPGAGTSESRPEAPARPGA